MSGTILDITKAKAKLARGASESSIERHLVKEVIKLGGYIRKIVSPGHAGFPDRLVIYKGLILFIELKRPKGGRVSALQKQEFKRLAEHGAQILILKSKDDVNVFIQRLKQL